MATGWQFPCTTLTSKVTNATSGRRGFSGVCFSENFERKEVCTVKLQQEDLQKLMEAIEDRYYFEFVFGEQPFYYSQSSEPTISR